jgi:glutaredoxin
LPRRGLWAGVIILGFYSRLLCASPLQEWYDHWRSDSLLFSCHRVRRQRYNRGVPDSRQVVIYSRKGCHLCEVVKESLVKLSRRGGFTWHEVDVDSDSELRRQFNDEVPVVFIDGRKAFKYRMDEREFLRKLAS